MNKGFHFIVLFCALILTQNSCVFRSVSQDKPEPVTSVEGCGTIEKLPFKEAWYGTYFQEDKVGYSHFRIEPAGENYSINTDSVMRLVALKKTNEISMKERVTVRPDLTMVGFESAVTMNGKDLKMTGTAKGEEFVVTINVEGEELTRTYPVDERLFHSSAISLMPALKGIEEGKRYAFEVFNAEKQGLEKVELEIRMVKGSPGPSGAVWRVKNRLGRSRIDSWLNRKGLTVLEKALGGSLITMLENEDTVADFLKKKSDAKDLILDFSLIPVTRRIPNPERVRFLKVRISGIEASLIPQDRRQTVTLVEDGQPGAGFTVSVRCEDLMEFDTKKRRIVRESSHSSSPVGAGSGSDPVLEKHLESTLAIQSDHEEIVDQARKIVRPTDSPMKKVSKLVAWMEENIETKMQDSFTALSVLRSREGECQSHAGLYAALARSQRIPTRVVTGLVYTEKVGFLYHAWAESYIDGWIAVDPTLNQVPADATHIKIAVDETGDEAHTLLEMVGKVKMEVIEFK
ncbi:MAG: transglutaminase-like domain-containing protein [Desulfomonilaceae bacterium]|nr:transglutaminase-like domain-containing protein [Desulfomonilaceae bacterium]